MTEIVFYPSLMSYKDDLENLEKNNDKSDDNLRKILYPYECICKNSKCTTWCRIKRGLDKKNIYQNEKNILSSCINNISKMEQKKQDILTNLITKDFNNNLVLNLHGLDSDDIESMKYYIIKKVKENFGYIYSINCKETRIRTDTLTDILDLIDSKTLKYLTIDHHCCLNKNLLFEKLIEKKFNLDSLDLDTTEFSLSEENLKYLSNLVKNNILNPNSLIIGSSMGVINYSDVTCLNKILKLKNICGNRLDRIDRILPNETRYKAFKPKNKEQEILKTKCRQILWEIS